MNTSTKTILKTFSLLAIASLSFLFFSFTDLEKRQSDIYSKTSQASLGVSELESIGSFKLDYSKFESLGGSWDRRLILKFSITTTASGNSYGLLAYLATSQEDHAANADAITLTPTSTGGLILKPGKEYHFGNNYIRLRSIRKYLRDIEEANPDAKISYLKFTAVTWKALDPENPSRNLEDIFFLIQAFDASDRLIKTNTVDVYSINSDAARDTEEGGTLSNPSPPADPSTN